MKVYVDLLADDLYEHYQMLFPNALQYLKNLYSEHRGLDRIDKTPFSSMEFTQDYSSMPHVDITNIVYGFIT